MAWCTQHQSGGQSDQSERLVLAGAMLTASGGATPGTGTLPGRQLPQTKTGLVAGRGLGLWVGATTLSQQPGAGASRCCVEMWDEASVRGQAAVIQE